MENSLKLEIAQKDKIINSYEEILCALLDCGYGDISLLKDIKYDFNEIIEQVWEINDCNRPKLNNILLGAMELFRYRISVYIRNELSENEDLNSGLEDLDIYEDTQTFVNYLDSHIYFICNEEKKALYKKYFLKEIEEENDMLGFSGLDLQ